MLFVLQLKLAFPSTIIFLDHRHTFAICVGNNKGLMAAGATMQSLLALSYSTVLGFYLLIAMGPNGFYRQLYEQPWFRALLPLLLGLLIASLFYSLPFVRTSHQMQ